MEISREELVKLFSKKRTSELLDILSNRQDYTELAVQVIKDEIEKRGIEQNDIEEFHASKIVQQDEKIKKAYFLELKFVEKLLVYFGFPLLFFGLLITLGAKNYLEKEGFFMKLKQAKLFLIISFVSLIITGIMLDYVDNIYLLSVWIGGFVIAIQIDKKASAKRKAEFIGIYGQEHFNEFYGQ
jgi:hypothetical protein